MLEFRTYLDSALQDLRRTAPSFLMKMPFGGFSRRNGLPGHEGVYLTLSCRMKYAVGLRHRCNRVAIS